MSIYREIADIQTQETLNLPRPEAKKENILLKPSGTQEEYVKQLGERAEKIRKREVNPKEDNMLKITNDGKKIALDQRLINPLLEDYENSKVNVCAESVYNIWNETKEKASTQLIFCDLSTPKEFKTKEELLSEEYVFTDVYNDMKRKLILKGIPENEIKFIHEADTEVKRKELFAKVKTGEVRVLIGSTQKMGAGTNVQDKLIALHHLDTPWKPSDLEQQEGRIIRQGNENPIVRIFTYLTEKTFDSYLYQILEKKQRYISQVMTSKVPIRDMEDVSEKALNYGEIKGLASGNEKIKDKIKLEGEISKLNILKQNFLNEKFKLEEMVSQHFPSQIDETNKKIADMEGDLIKRNEYTIENKEGFSPMVIDNHKYEEKEQAGKMLLAISQNMKIGEERHIGKYRGFDLKLKVSMQLGMLYVELELKNKHKYSVYLGTDTFGNITRINNCLDNLEREIQKEKERLEDLNKQFENAKIEISKDFEQEKELKEKTNQLKEINEELGINENEKDDASVFEDFEEESREKETINKRKFEYSR